MPTIRQGLKSTGEASCEWCDLYPCNYTKYCLRKCDWHSCTLRFVVLTFFSMQGEGSGVKVTIQIYVVSANKPVGSLIWCETRAFDLSLILSLRGTNTSRSQRKNRDKRMSHQTTPKLLNELKMSPLMLSYLYGLIGYHPISWLVSFCWRSGPGIFMHLRNRLRNLYIYPYQLPVCLHLSSSLRASKIHNPTLLLFKL